MAHKFVLRDTGGRDNSIGEATSIGRDAACQIILSGDPRVSRRHALLWAQGDTLFVRDENSSNGTFVNGQQLTPNKATPLRPGDKLGVGDTLFLVMEAELPPTTVIQPGRGQRTSAAPAPAPATAAAPGRSRSLLLGGCLVLLLLAVCGGLGLFGATAGRPALSTALAQVSGPATPGATVGAFSAQVVSTSPPPTPLAPADYAATGQDLAAALAALNQAQLRFIADTKTKMSALDEDLRAIAASAFKVGLDGETLASATAAQDGASDPAVTMGGLYAGLAGYGYAQAIDAQNLRTSLAAGTLDAAAAAAQVADYGARAWNPTVTEPAIKGNPFLAHLAPGDQVPAPAPIPPAGQATIMSALGAGAGPFTWLAAPSGTLTRTVSLPLGQPLADPQDPVLLAALMTPAGQADARRAQQGAAAGLLRLGAARQRPTGRHPAGLLAALWSPPEQAAKDLLEFGAPWSMLLSDSPQTGTLQAFGNGHASAAKANPPASGSSAPNVIDTLFGTDANNQPTQQGTVPVQAKAPVISLTITNVTVKSVSKRDKSTSSTFEAEVQYEFDVQWTSSLVAPQFTLDCVSGNHFEITAASGTQHISAKGLLILYPGAEDAYCYASRNGNSLGSASLRFLVGDPAEATQRAIQVETDSAVLDLTLTADAVGTQSAESTNAAATRSALGTQNALETEQAAQQTQEFAATITAIAHLTQVAVPVATQSPSPTPTFEPVFLEELFHPGNVFAVSTKTVLQPNRLYQFCFSGTVYLVNPDQAAKPSDLDHVNGVAVPASGCMVVEGNGKVAVISCGKGEAAPEPGGFTIRVVDLGPT